MFFYNESDSETSQIGGGSTDEHFYNASLLLNMDSDFSDSSANNHAVTVNGNASISTTESKFGGGSGYFDGSGDYLTIPSNTAFAMDTGDFTIELWYQPLSVSGNPGVIGNYAYSWRANSWQIHAPHDGFGSGFSFWVNNFGSTPLLQATSGLQIGVWTHLAVTREGNTWRMFIDGQLESTATSSLSLDGGTGQDGLYIGVNFVNSLQRYANAYMDDIRITKGVARYTTNFTPPTEAHPTTGPTGLITSDLQLHLDAGDASSYSGTGTVWYDLSSNSNDATAVNGIEGTWHSDGYFDFEQTASPDPHFTLGSPASLQFQAHTIEVWINPEDISNTNNHAVDIHPVFSSQYDGTTSGISLNVDGRSNTHGGGPNGIHYQVGLGSNFTTDGSYGTTSANSVSEGVWQNFVVSWQSGGTKKVYRNGNLIQTLGTWSGTVNWSSANWFIGIQGNDQSTRQFDGKIAVIRAYSRELTSGEILQNFHATKDRFGL